MTLASISVLVLYFILCVQGEIYLYGNESIIFTQVFEDIISPSGPQMPFAGLEGYLRESLPPLACSPINGADRDKLFVIIRRGNCTFEAKVRNAQAANFSAVIVYNVGSNDLLRMPYDNNTGINIPAVFVSEESGLVLLYNANVSGTHVLINESFHVNTDVLFAFCLFVFVAFFCMLGSICYRYISNRRRRRRNLLPASVLKSIPKQKYDKNLLYETCVICQENFNQGDIIRILPCSHAYHAKCIDVWLTQYRRVCAVCKRRVLAPGEVPPESDDESDVTTGPADDTTPLLRGSNETRRRRLLDRLNLSSLRERLGLGRRDVVGEFSDQQATSSSQSQRAGLIHSVNAGPDEFEDSSSYSSSSTGDVDSRSVNNSNRAMPSVSNEDLVSNDLDRSTQSNGPGNPNSDDHLIV